MNGPRSGRNLLLTLDVGTTSVKACVFSPEFVRLGFAQEEYGLQASDAGFLELDTETYWSATLRVVKDALSPPGIDPRLIASFAVTTQGETLIAVDRSGIPVRKAIVWLDSRAVSEAARLRDSFSSDEFYRRTGISELGPSCPVSKILWIKDNEPEIFASTDHFLLLLDFLLFRLTGRFVTDRCILSSTGYFDIQAGELWPEMLSAIGVAIGHIPEPIDCGDCAGHSLPGVSLEMGIPIETPIVSAGMDQAACALGAGNYSEGSVTETTGTALVVAATVERPFFGNPARPNIMRHAVAGRYLVLPYNQTAGIVLKWFKEEFCQDLVAACGRTSLSVYAAIDGQAAEAPPLSGGVILLPHFTGMLTPTIDPSVRGVFFGVGLDTKRSHFARAILEGIAYMLRENLELLASMGIRTKELRSLGGGAKSRLWCAIKASITNVEIHVLQEEEATSLGAAILGSLNVGIHGTVEEACRASKTLHIHPPDPTLVPVYDIGFSRYRALLEALKPLFGG